MTFNSSLVARDDQVIEELVLSVQYNSFLLVARLPNWEDVRLIIEEYLRKIFQFLISNACTPQHSQL